MRHRPVCAKCECELKPKENGIGLLDMFNPSDKSGPQPYQLWDADLYKCPKCGYEIVIGFGDLPMVEHWEEDEHLERTMYYYEANNRRVIRNYL